MQLAIVMFCKERPGEPRNTRVMHHGTSSQKSFCGFCQTSKQRSSSIPSDGKGDEHFLSRSVFLCLGHFRPIHPFGFDLTNRIKIVVRERNECVCRIPTDCLLLFYKNFSRVCATPAALEPRPDK